MIKCEYCNADNESHAKFCSACGKPLEFKPSSVQTESTGKTLVMVFGILTIVGSLIGLFFATIYKELGDVGVTGRNNWLIWFILHFGTLIGAILILSKQPIGLYIYSIFEIVYIGYILYTSPSLPHEIEQFMVLYFFAFLVFPLAFIIVYWLPISRKAIFHKPDSF